MSDLNIIEDPVDAAERRASYIRTDLQHLIDQRDRIIDMIEEAKAAQDHVVLGYDSWTAYVAKEFGGLLAELDREDRRDFTAILSSTGMSQRGIAEITGVSVGTVNSDLRAGVQSLNTCEAQVPHRGTPAPVTGLDGKTYAAERPERREPRRRPITDAYADAIYDLGKIVERLERLTEDDRFPSNRTTLGERNGARLARAHKILFQCRSALNGGEQR